MIKNEVTRFFCNERYRRLIEGIELRDVNTSERFKSAEAALRLQAKEMERRLEQLNELRKEYTSDRTQDQKVFVRQEIYYSQIGVYNDFVTHTRDRLTTLETRLAVWMSVLGGALFLLQIILYYFKK